jgi:Tfp pilus assembly protein PilV
MSDEFDHNPENNYSAFWPLLILTVGLLGWMGYQDYATNSQRSVYDKQFQAAIPTINEAQNVSTRYVSLMKDLVQTAQKDTYAAQIVKDAIKANMIQVHPNATNSDTTPAEPK